MCERKQQAIGSGQPHKQMSFFHPDPAVTIHLRSDPNFTINIDTKTPNPAKAYEHEMKSLLMEDIKNGMKERSKSIKQKN